MWIINGFRRVILPPCQEQTAGAEFVYYYPIAINLLSGKSYLTECAKEMTLPSYMAETSMLRRWNSSMSV